ncbi:hypothetical protein [Kribbella sp. HUAS MG21]|uniref:Uncharacterized protein n=1 Tax=Kribbella sp. HUAS MG21 TaxID=3160966 RepID=A0AAU7T328_9ACTN
MRFIWLSITGLLLAAATGCGGPTGADPGVASAEGTTGTPAPTSSPSSTPTGTDLLKFAQCMRANGVDVPDPDPAKGLTGMGEIDRDDPDFKPAMTKCKQYLSGLGGDPSSPEYQAQLLAFAQCMRDHGADVPDPDPNGGFGGKGLDRSDPDVKAALEACHDKLPNAGQSPKSSA